MGKYKLPDGRIVELDDKKVLSYKQEVMRARNPVQLDEVVVTAPSTKKVKADKAASDFNLALIRAKEDQEYMKKDLLGYMNYKNAQRNAKMLAYVDDAILRAEEWKKQAAEYEKAKKDSKLMDPKFLHKVNVAAADKQVKKTAFTDEKTLPAFLNFVTPSQLVGAIIDKFQGEGYWNSLREGNSGFVSDKFMLEHPGWGHTINFVGDVALPVAVKPTIAGVNYLAKAAPKTANNLLDRAGVFVQKPNSYTRGIGTDLRGIEDLVLSGVIRGNPAGAEVRAKTFAKLVRRNRTHGRETFDATGIPNIAEHWYNRSLTENEFNALKKAHELVSAKYPYKAPEGVKIKTKFGDLDLDVDPYGSQRNPNVFDPLEDYSSYKDYLKVLDEDRKTFRMVPTIGEDRQPLAYFYNDGRNPITRGHDYARSNYGVRINNIDQYDTFIHPEHLHWSTRRAVSLDDPNVEVFRRGPFGLTLRMNKNKLLPQPKEPFKGIKVGNYYYKVDPNTMSVGIPTIKRTPAEQWQLLSLPGMQIKSLLTNGPLEKQLSKSGTISTKLLQAYIGRNDVPTHDKYLIQLVLDNHAGETHLDYNTLRSEVQGMIPVYNRVPQTQYDSYGIKSLGIDVSPRGAADKLFASEYNGRELVSRRRRWPGDPIGGEVVPGEQVREEALAYMKEHPTEFTQLKTFTFESPGIKGNQKHYKSGEPLGHSRTYISKDEPDVLHVMESQSDWAQAGGISPDTPKREMILNEINKVKQDLDSENFMFKSRQELEWELEDLEKLMQEYYGQASSPVQDRMINSYTSRLIQENLKFAAENGQSKMRYPTPETAAKIEGYTKDYKSPKDPAHRKALEALQAQLKGKINSVQSYESTDRIHSRLLKTDPEYAKIMELIREYESAPSIVTYQPKHQTILKKYADFPKQYEKLFGKGTVKLVTDAKGNTWYEVDIPENYVKGTAEMLFKTGGKLTLKNFKYEL